MVKKRNKIQLMAHVKIEKERQLQIFGNVLHKLCLSSASEVNRPVLCCINFKERNGYLEIAATNGYMLSIARWRHSFKGLGKVLGDKGKLFHRAGLLNLAKMSISATKKDSGALVFKARKDGKVDLHLLSAEKGIQKVCSQEIGVFPDYSFLIPKYKEIESKHSLFNPEYLKSTMEFLSFIINKDDRNFVSIKLNAHNSPARFEARGPDWDGLVVVMPVAPELNKGFGAISESGVKYDIPFEDGDPFTQGGSIGDKKDT